MYICVYMYVCIYISFLFFWNVTYLKFNFRPFQQSFYTNASFKVGWKKLEKIQFLWEWLCLGKVFSKCYKHARFKIKTIDLCSIAQTIITIMVYSQNSLTINLIKDGKCGMYLPSSTAFYVKYDFKLPNVGNLEINTKSNVLCGHY